MRALALSPDGKTLYSGSGDSTIRAWNTESGAVRRLRVAVICPAACARSPGLRVSVGASPLVLRLYWS